MVFKIFKMCSKIAYEREYFIFTSLISDIIPSVWILNIVRYTHIYMRTLQGRIAHSHTNSCHQHKSHAIRMCWEAWKQNTSKHNKSNLTCIYMLNVNQVDRCMEAKNIKNNRTKEVEEGAHLHFIMWYDTFMIIMKCCTIFISISPIKNESTCTMYRVFDGWPHRSVGWQKLADCWTVRI